MKMTVSWAFTVIPRIQTPFIPDYDVKKAERRVPPLGQLEGHRTVLKTGIPMSRNDQEKAINNRGKYFVTNSVYLLRKLSSPSRKIPQLDVRR